MQIRNFLAIVLSHYTDEISHLSYIKVLNESKVETLKLPTSITNYRYQHLLRPNFLLEMEVVKTKKNWILTGILSYQPFCYPKSYHDYLKLAAIINLLNQFCHEEQPVKILHWLTKELDLSNLEAVDLNLFESELLKQLGFIPELKTNQNLAKSLTLAKAASGLI